MIISIPDADAEGYLHSLEVAHRNLPADALSEHFARIRHLADLVEKAVAQQSYGYVPKRPGSNVLIKNN